MQLKTPDKRVEEIVEEFRKEFLSDRGYGEVPQYVPAQFDFSDYTDWLRTTLTQYHQDIAAALVEALEEKIRLAAYPVAVTKQQQREYEVWQRAMCKAVVIIRTLLESKN